MPLVNCFSTLGCPQLSLHQAIELAQAQALSMVEVRTVSGSNDLPAVLGQEFGSPEELTAYLADTSVAIPVAGSSHRLIGSAFDFQELQELARWADAAGARFLRVFDGDGDALDAGLLDVAQARYEQWETMRADQGIQVRLLIETHGVLCAHPALEAFCNRLPTIPILWDTHHTWAAGNDLAATYKTIGQRLAHVHVKDSIITNGKRRYVLPGEGDFPVGILLELLLDERTSAPAFSLEWEKHWHPELPSLELALAAATNWR